MERTPQTTAASVAPDRLHSRPDEGATAIAKHLHCYLTSSAAARRRVYRSAAILYLGSLAFGFTVSYSAPALPDIRKKHDFSGGDSDWFGSILNIGAVIGALVAGYLVNRVGRKMTMVVSALCFVAGWLCIIFASEAVVLLFVGRCTTGFALGIIALALPVFISEISPTDIRGLLNSGSVAIIHSGILVLFVLGKWLDYTSLAAASMVPVLVMVPCLFWVKESPTWLLQKDKKSESLESLLFYMGPHVQTDFNNPQAGESGGEEFKLSELRLPYIYKPFLCTLLAMFLQQFSGISILLYFAHDIFESAGTTMSSSDCAIVVGVVQVLTIMISTVLTDQVGRKILFLLSVGISSVSLFTLGLCFHLKALHGEQFLSSYGWLPLATVSAYFFGYALGLAGLPWVLLGEVLPQRAKGFATGFCTAFNFGASFVVVKEFQDFLHFFGSAGIYWFYAAALAVGFVLFLVFVPETKGKGLEEIEKLFGKTCAESPVPSANAVVSDVTQKEKSVVLTGAIYLEDVKGCPIDLSIIKV